MALRQLPVAVLFVALCCWLGGTAGARAAEGPPGAVDPSFGGGGVVAQPPRQLFPPNGAVGPIGEDMVVGPDDEIFLLLSLQECEITCRIRFVLQRYLPDGRLDVAFGREGTSTEVVVNAEEKLVPIERFSFGSLAVGPGGNQFWQPQKVATCFSSASTGRVSWSRASGRRAGFASISVALRPGLRWRCYLVSGSSSPAVPTGATAASRSSLACSPTEI